MNFQGKVAIVTGGAKGVGRAICTSLLKIGMRICICDINKNSAESFLNEMLDDAKPNVITVNCDVSTVDAFRAAFQETIKTFGRVDVLINNAGIMNEHEWQRVVDINFIGVINGIHLAFEFMGTNNGGSGGYIINTASIAGLVEYSLAPIYAGCKHGVVGLTKSYGSPYHFEKTGITVNAVCPGAVDTELFHAFPDTSVDKELGKKHLSNLKPVSPDEVSKAVLQLLQDSKNGALLRVDINGIRYVE